MLFLHTLCGPNEMMMLMAEGCGEAAGGPGGLDMQSVQMHHMQTITKAVGTQLTTTLPSCAAAAYLSP